MLGIKVIKIENENKVGDSHGEERFCYKNKKLKTEIKYLKYFRTEDGSSGYLRLK